LPVVRGSSRATIGRGSHTPYSTSAEKSCISSGSNLLRPGSEHIVVLDSAEIRGDNCLVDRKAATTRKRKKPKTRAGRSRAETWRLKRLLQLEQGFWEQGIEYVAGVDEVGRGPLAGPVLAAAVIMPRGVSIRGVHDSKQLTAEKRERLFQEIREKAVCIGIGGASTREIDRLNILRASHVAMLRALQRLRVQPQHIVIDGLRVATLPDHTAVIDGDAKVHCVACASIVAKVVRDRLMRRLAPRYPIYGWEHNAGYATADHRLAIDTGGLSPHHRRSFIEQQLMLELT
jgi:ribonuclease HII